MGLVNWLKNTLFPKKVKEKLFEQGAYHESGHIVMAYLTRFKSDEVKLFQNDPGSGVTKFDYGDPRIPLLVAAMQNYTQDPSFYNGLDNALKNSATQIALKIVGTLLGGPVSEALHKFGVEYEGELIVEMSGPDLINVQSIHMCLSSNFSNHDPDYITSSLKQVVSILRQADYWKSIQHLSSTLMNSPSKHLNREQIENSLLTSGYLSLIK
ncbi:hypothetical protein [Algoriphagus aquimarinus]|uniref:hypothetical protein n=1 Tax=Algoriphagus aquimarinus TaxID=237018 RepID=UPI0030DA8ED6|tara:strand:+ start:7875 stop:8507 length:633 start_codon:yes stop_codon:yes gene_type:complete